MSTTTAPSSASSESTTADAKVASWLEPLPYKKSFSQWLSAPTALEAQESLLSFLPFYPQSDSTRTARINKVDIGGKNYINEFEIVNTEPAQVDTGFSNDMVVLHGYGAGLGLFITNFDKWSTVKGSRTFALDLLGFGLSARPKFQLATKNVAEKDDQGNFKAVVETEDWFVDSIEEWRKAKKLEKFTLAGHSMGGYLAAAYAFRYPERVERLVMISPAGVERGYKPELERKSLFGGKPSSKDVMAEADVADPLDELADEKSTSARNFGNTFQYFWNSHISPFVVLKATTFLGPRMISQWSNRRFNKLPDEQRESMHMYVYKIFTARASGEYAITRLLAPGAVARMPLVDRVVSRIKCPTLWVYGDNDWMNQHAGNEAVQRLQKAGLYSEHHVIENAGHHVYLDNPPAFDRVLLKFLSRPKQTL